MSLTPMGGGHLLKDIIARCIQGMYMMWMPEEVEETTVIDQG